MAEETQPFAQRPGPFMFYSAKSDYPVVAPEAQPRKSTQDAKDNSSDSGYKKTAGKSVYQSRRPSKLAAEPRSKDDDSSDESDSSHSSRSSSRQTHGGKTVIATPDSRESAPGPRSQSRNAHGKRPAYDGKSVPGYEPKRPQEYEPPTATTGPRTSASAIVDEMEVVDAGDGSVKCSA
ncbi:hypothetical protein ACMFMF_005049 [Clarireedia jacksonii]